MTGARFDRFLASTAVALFLSAAPLTSYAEPLNDAAPPVPAATAEAMPVPAAEAAAQPAADAPQAVETTGTTISAAPAEKPADTTAAKPAEAAPAVTATPAPAAPAASKFAAADAAVADQLRTMSSGQFDQVVGGKQARTVIDAFYSGRDYAPLWITDGKPNAHAKAAIAYLGHVDADGLDPADYPVPNFAAINNPDALAEAELKLSNAVITYARHASVGRIHWSRVSPDINYNTVAPEPADVLARLAEAQDTAAALDGYEPQAHGYQALKAKLAEIRAGKADAAPASSKPGQKGAAQEQRPDHPTEIILANMERWRWMPHDLGRNYVMVNLPDFMLHVMHDGKQIWETRIVIGKPAMPTPIMTEPMRYITINPTWHVPPSIVHHEYLPALAQDPTVMARMGLRVGRNPDGSVAIWQPPGDNNALGRIRFNFPNKFLVYQHDTPDKYMFAYDKRAYSHGCMRVQDPAKYAEVLLSLARPGEGYTAERIKHMFGDNETDIQFPTFIPVNLTYQTAFVDDAGKLEFREDVYGRDHALIALMKGAERRNADVALHHEDNVLHRQVMAIPDQPSLWGNSTPGAPAAAGRGARSAGRSHQQPGGFFGQLFGGFNAGPPVPRRSIPQHRREAAAH